MSPWPKPKNTHQHVHQHVASSSAPAIELVEDEEEFEEEYKRIPLRVVSFKMDPILLKKLDELARECKVTRSELIRTAIECLISEMLE